MEKDYDDQAREAFKMIVDADRVESLFAENSDLEGQLTSTRNIAEEMEGLFGEKASVIAFNYLMAYAYQPFMKIPGVARFATEQREYFSKRAKMFE